MNGHNNNCILQFAVLCFTISLYVETTFCEYHPRIPDRFFSLSLPFANMHMDTNTPTQRQRKNVMYRMHAAVAAAAAVKSNSQLRARVQ